MNKLFLNVLLVFLLVLSCKNKKATEGSRVAALPYYSEASFTPKWIVPNSDALTRFHKILAFNLTNQNGESVTHKTFENKIYVADFFFTTCPGICPMMTRNMHKIQEAFRTDTDVLLLSHSVTPEKDSVPVLKEYALEKKIQAQKWHLVTGNRKQIYALGRQSYFVEENIGEPLVIDDFLHTENFVLVDKQKHIRGIYNGLNRTSIAQLIIDIKTLQKE